MITLEQLKQAIAEYKAPCFGRGVRGVDAAVMSISWLTGGKSGGTCWGDKPKKIRPEDEPVHEFEEMALKVFEYITGHELQGDDALLYTMDVYDNSTTTSDSDSGYYGDWSEFDVRYTFPETIYDIVYNHSRIARIDEILEDLEAHGL